MVDPPKTADRSLVHGPVVPIVALPEVVSAQAGKCGEAVRPVDVMMLMMLMLMMFDLWIDSSRMLAYNGSGMIVSLRVVVVGARDVSDGREVGPESTAVCSLSPWCCSPSRALLIRVTQSFMSIRVSAER